MSAISDINNFNPETDADNFAEIEQQFAVKTVEHLEAYQNLLENVDPRKLKLTNIDDDLYEDLMTRFPEFKDTENLRVLDEDKMKSRDGKERWRAFIMPYENKLTDYNFGTLIRRDADREYSEDNTILVTRCQFDAIEVARNRLGVNDKFHQAAQKAKKGGDDAKPTRY